MSITPDEMNRVIYSKYLIERAKAHQAQQSELGSAQAILAAHDGAEMLMKVVYDNLKIPPPMQFMKFWELLEKHPSGRPPFKSSMNGLNNQRNEFKHGGRLPHLKNVAAILPDVIAFCEEISRLYLDLDYKSASLSTLVEQVEAKNHLMAAEVAHRDANNREAFQSLRWAYLDLLSSLHDKHGDDLPSRMNWRLPRISTGHSGVDKEIEGAVRSFNFESIVRHLNYITETLGMVILGIDVTLLRRFNRKVPVLQWTGLTKADYEFRWPTPVEELKKEDFDFCYSFLIEIALRQM